MTLLQAYHTLTFDDLKAAKERIIWERLDQLTVEHAVVEWLDNFSPITQETYRTSMRSLVKVGLLHPSMTLQAFALVHYEAILDKIKLVDIWKEKTRQARAAAFISLTSYLARKHPAIFRKAMTQKHGAGKTFFRVHEKVVTQAMSALQVDVFFYHLSSTSARDALIGKIILQGGKRVSEVLKLKIEDIDFDKKEISFLQSKTGGCIRYTVITYADSIMTDLKKYIGERKGLVFVTTSDRQVTRHHLYKTFFRAGKKASIPFRITPHVLRTTAVTLLRSLGFSDSDIQKVTGHASSDSVHAYDKSDRCQNASKKINLIT